MAKRKMPKDGIMRINRADLLNNPEERDACYRLAQELENARIRDAEALHRLFHGQQTPLPKYVIDTLRRHTGLITSTPTP